MLATICLGVAERQPYLACQGVRDTSYLCRILIEATSPHPLCSNPPPPMSSPAPGYTVPAHPRGDGYQMKVPPTPGGGDGHHTIVT